MTKMEAMEPSSLKDLGLYSSFDVSRWCTKNRILSVYVERYQHRVMDVDWTYLSAPFWAVKDSKQPNKILKKFVLRNGSTMSEVRTLAEAWVDAQFDCPMTYLPSLGASFPTAAVEILADELAHLYKVWNLDPKTGVQITQKKAPAARDYILAALTKETVS